MDQDNSGEMMGKAIQCRTHKADMHKGKYILTVKVNGIYKLCYDMFYKLLYFDTIKDAQREVLYSADFIRTM